MKKIRLSQTQLKDMVKKVLDEGHHKSYMAKSQLYNIAKKSQSMFDRLEKGEPLDDWMESKIAQMANMMNSVSDAFNYDEHHEKECPDGMYWCEKDGICKPDSQKMDQLITTVEMNEAIGFTKTYERELPEHLNSFVNVVCGHIKNQIKTKDLYSDEVIVQRLYQLLVEGGELHEPVQELINLIDSLDDKEKKPLGFKGTYKTTEKEMKEGVICEQCGEIHEGDCAQKIREGAGRSIGAALGSTTGGIAGALMGAPLDGPIPAGEVIGGAIGAGLGGAAGGFIGSQFDSDDEEELENIIQGEFYEEGTNGVKKDLYKTLKLAKPGEFTEEERNDSLLSKIMAKIKGVSAQQMEYNRKNDLPLDWQGSVEGYHEFITNKRFYSGSN